MKRLLSVILCLIMVLSLLPFSALAEDLEPEVQEQPESAQQEESAREEEPEEEPKEEPTGEKENTEAEGHAEKADGDVCSVTIGESTLYYSSFDDGKTAVLAAGTNPVTLTLLADWTTGQIALRSDTYDYTERDITINLNNKSITNSSAKNNLFLVNKNSTVTITGDGTVTTNSKAIASLNSGAKAFNIKGGTYNTGTAADLFAGTSKENAKIFSGTFSDKPDNANISENANITIKLLKDEKLESSWVLKAKTTTTLDLNGYTLSTTAEGAIRVINLLGSLTVIDSGSTGIIKGNTNSNNSIIYLNSAASLTVNGGTIASYSETPVINEYQTSGKHGKIVINYGIVIGDIKIPAKTSSETDYSAYIEIKGGWFSDSVSDYLAPVGEGETAYELVEVKTGAPATGLKAVTNRQVTITYNLDGGSDGPDSLSKYCPENCTVEIKTRIATPWKTGCRFINWKDTNDKEYESGATIEIGEDLALTAQYEATTDRVAKIDDNEYVTLAEAISTIDEEAVTITLIDNVSENVKLTEGKTCTFDLNGHSITGASTGSAVTVSTGAVLTVDDSSDGQNGSIYGEAQTWGGGIDVAGTLYLKAGSVSGYAPSGGGGIRLNKGVAYIQGGSVRGTVNDPDNTENQTARIEQAIYANSNTATKLYISGGIVKGNIYKGKNATVSITGGSFSEDPTARLADGYAVHHTKVEMEAPYSVYKGSFIGGGLRRRVESGTVNVVNTSTDMRLEFNFVLPEGATDVTGTFCWSKDGSTPSKSVEMSKKAAESGVYKTYLVVTGVPSSFFADGIIKSFLTVKYKLGDNEYSFTTNEGSKSVNEICDNLKEKFKDETTNTWYKYAQYLLGEITEYSIA